MADEETEAVEDAAPVARNEGQSTDAERRAAYIEALRNERASVATNNPRHDQRVAEIDAELAQYEDAPKRRGAPSKAVR